MLAALRTIINGSSFTKRNSRLFDQENGMQRVKSPSWRSSRLIQSGHRNRILTLHQTTDPREVRNTQLSMVTVLILPRCISDLSTLIDRRSFGDKT